MSRVVPPARVLAERGATGARERAGPPWRDPGAAQRTGPLKQRRCEGSSGGGFSDHNSACRFRLASGSAARASHQHCGRASTGRIAQCWVSSISAVRGRSNRCAKTAPLPRSRSRTLRSSSCRIGPGALLRPGPPQNRTCIFQRIRLKQAGEGPVARRRTIRSRNWSVSSAGPFTATLVAASNLSVGSGVVVSLPFAGSPDRVSALSRPGTWPGIRPVMRDGRLEGAAITSRFPVAFPLPAFASRSSDSRRGTGPSSRWAYRTRPQARSGPRRGYRVPHARAATGVGAPYTPRTAVLFPAEGRAQPAPAARRRPVLITLLRHPTGRALLHEASTRVHAIHPSGLPWPVAARVERAALGLLRGLHTPPLPAAHAEDGTGRRARTWNYALTSVDPPIR